MVYKSMLTTEEVRSYILRLKEEEAEKQIIVKGW
jgi:glutamate synthase domain-containing protein 1